MANNIDINIRARDQASAALQEVAANVNSLADRITGAAGLVAGMTAAVIGGKQLADMLSGSTDAFIAQEKALRGLSEADAVFAAQVQDQLAVGDELVLGIMRRAKMLGVEEQQLNDTALAAIGLSEVTGQGLNESLKASIQVLNGNAGALSEYLPQLKGLATEEEKLAMVTEAANRGLLQKVEAASQLEGAVARSANSLQDLSAKFGELIEPILIVVHQGIAVFAEVAEQALEPAIAAVNATIGKTSEVVQNIAPIIIGVVTAVEVAFTQMQTVVDLAITTVSLALLNFALDVEHQLTKVVPEYLKWFSENWVNIFSDMASAVMTVLQNLGNNIGETVFAIFDWIANGFEGGMGGLLDRLDSAVYKGLLDGFEATTGELPRIMERQLTGAERDLATKMAKLGISLGDSFSAKFDGRMNAMKAAMADFSVQAGKATAAANIGFTGGGPGALQATQGRLVTGKGDYQSRMMEYARLTAEGVAKLNRKPAPKGVEVRVNRA